jgi:hypothetical protein
MGDLFNIDYVNEIHSGNAVPQRNSLAFCWYLGSANLARHHPEKGNRT